MNREILFRGKRADNGEWVQGYYAEFYNHTKHQMFCEDGCFEVDPSTVCEYVPKEGFYEGDVLYGNETDEYGFILSSWCGFVKYDETSGRIRIQDDSGEWYETDDFNYDKIIGNIYDKPELLEAST